MDKKQKTCPYCGEEILAVAKKCKHCGEFLEEIDEELEEVDEEVEEDEEFEEEDDDEEESEPKGESWIERLGATIGTLIGIVISAFILHEVRPMRADHVDTVTRKFLDTYCKEVGVNSLPSDSYKIVHREVEKNLEFHDYFVFTTASLKIRGEESTVSWGAAYIVFPSNDKLSNLSKEINE